MKAIKFQSNRSRFVGFQYVPTPVWAQKSGHKLKPFVHVHFYFLSVIIGMPFKHNAKKAFGSRSERYGFCTNFKDYTVFHWGDL